MKLKQPPATGQENFQHMTIVSQQENMCTCKIFLRLCNNKNVVSTLEAMQKMVEFYHNKGIHMLKLGCILANPAKICLHKSTVATFYLFTECNEDLCKRYPKSWLLDHPLLLRWKLLWKKLLFGNRQTGGNPLSFYMAPHVIILNRLKAYLRLELLILKHCRNILIHCRNPEYFITLPF